MLLIQFYTLYNSLAKDGKLKLTRVAVSESQKFIRYTFISKLIHSTILIDSLIYIRYCCEVDLTVNKIRQTLSLHGAYFLNEQKMYFVILYIMANIYWVLPMCQVLYQSIYVQYLYFILMLLFMLLLSPVYRWGDSYRELK